MAEVGFVILANESRRTNNIFNITDPISTMMVPFLPTQQTFVLSFSVFYISIKIKYVCEITIDGPNNELVDFTRFEFDVNEPPHTPEGKQLQYADTIISLPYKNMVFYEDGVHTFKVRILEKENTNVSESIVKVPIFEIPPNEKGDKNG